MITYRIDSKGTFVTTDYQRAPTWSSFFPGIAGAWGIPLWAFFINRGQAIAGFGIRGKDEPIMEYWPANKAYQIAPVQGFRTFIKLRRGKGAPVFYEPFSTTGSLLDASVQSEMRVAAHELTIGERNAKAGLSVEVRYFTLPGEAYPALVREVTLTNRGRSALSLDLLDGLAVIFPYGVNNWFLKEMSRTIEAWMTVDETHPGVPLFKLSTDPRDVAEVAFIKGGNFYLGFEEGRPVSRTRIVYDPRAVFGPVADLSVPVEFAGRARWAFPKRQIARNLTPCAFQFWTGALPAGSSRRFFSVVGHVFDAGDINRLGLSRLTAEALDGKRRANERLIRDLEDRVMTVSGEPAIDLYTRQTYLDNVLRGGLPVALPGSGTPEQVIYVYSRKHGDLERDYNRFSVAPTYFSKGEGNYRDVNQNRRCDVFFEPGVGAKNLCEFMNLIQLDGYNPLTFKGERFRVDPDVFLKSPCASRLPEKEAHKIAHVVGRGFDLGELLRAMEEGRMRVEGDLPAWVASLIGMAEVHEDAAHGEGYWVDHWTYNTDLLESFAAVFPDRVRRVLFEETSTTYHDTHVHVRPRSEKYVMHLGEVHQHHALFHDEEKNLFVQKRPHGKNLVRTKNGEGDVLVTTMIAKFVCLVANKASTLDPSGIGIEMEADKPGWYDALNGLPALFGSSVPETLELKRLTALLTNLAESSGIGGDFGVVLPSEVADFVDGLIGLAPSMEPFAYWEAAGLLKETYRARVRRGVSGEMRTKRWSEIDAWLDAVGQRSDAAIDRAIDPKTGEIATYFVHKVKRYESRTDASGRSVIHVLAFEARRLPLFLEGFVHALRARPHSASSLIKALNKSALYDKKLRMLRVNDSLDGEPFEIGRAKAFTPGWLENGSIWLHMEYKWLLELLRSGSAEEFFEAFDRMLIPRQKASVYGRSPLENSSFIVSSVHPDATLHGRGFVARLSGSTVEFLHMRLLMNTGPAPFSLDERGALTLRFRPCLRASFFTRRAASCSFKDADGRERTVEVPKDSLAFLFLGRTVVLYKNDLRRDTFGPRAATIRRMVLRDDTGRVREIEGDTVPSSEAAEVRDGLWTTIEATLA